MPKFKFGNMFKSNGVIIATTNSFIRNDGKLAMGRGSAKQLRDSFRGIDKIFGDKIKNICGHLGIYGLLFYNEGFNNFGIFQTKIDFKDKSITALIKKSTDMLRIHSLKNENETFNLGFPGIGNGKLNKNTIMDIIEILPDNVIIWEKN